MFAHLDPTRLLRYAGLFTWAVVGLPLLLLSQLAEPADETAVAATLGWQAWLAWATFGFSYAWLTRALSVRRGSAFDYLLLVLLTGSAIAISYYSGSGLGSILLMVVACVLPWLLPLPVGIAVLALSELVVVPVYMGALGFSWFEALMQAILYVGFAGFVFVTSMVARQQAQARDEQRRLNAELRATRALLAESARVNERTRISRELHDLLGHHLTALSLNLEVASHLTEGKAHEHVGQAHTLARLLLSDVREAVSQIRGNDAIDMAATLLPLADNVPGLHIDMVMPKPFLLDDPERAHVLLRCTQEIITNAVRHAQAQVLRLRYGWDGDAIRLQARDDGRGSENPDAGNGLAGMRERLATYGGELEVESAPGQGFTLRLHLPRGRSPALGKPAPRPVPAA
ncbi:sensor histidine kinase [Luteimonas sp. 22616]|uniref:sensor histidine kinase n=1 Tax=Luteimonas sp. 22616 TaxID=3453951 RepID=UPI003F852610